MRQSLNKKICTQLVLGIEGVESWELIEKLKDISLEVFLHAFDSPKTTSEHHILGNSIEA